MYCIWTFPVRHSHSGSLLWLASVTELVFSVASMFEDMSVLRYFFFGTVFHHRGTLLFIYPVICGRTRESLDFGAIVNNAALQMCAQVFRQMFSVLVSRSGSAEACVTPRLTFLGTCRGFSKVAAPLYVPTLGGRGSDFSILIGARNSVFCSSHPRGCEVVSQRSELRFPNDPWCWTSFLCAYLAISLSISEKFLFGYFVHFKIELFVFLLGYKNSLYILDTSSISDLWFVIIFSLLRVVFSLF